MKKRLRNLDLLNLGLAFKALAEIKTAPDQGKTRFAIARNLRRLSDIGDALNAARAGIPAGPDQDRLLREFLAEEGPESVDLFPVEFSALDVDANNVSPMVLAALDQAGLLLNPPALS